MTAIDAERLEAITSWAGSAPDKLTVTLLWDAEEDLDLAFVCQDGVKINWDNSKGENGCAAVYDVEEGIAEYGSERGDGSVGQLENIKVSTPTNNIAYQIMVTHYTRQAPVDFMLFFSGLDVSGELVIFESYYGTLDPGDFAPEETPEYVHTFTYLDPLGQTTEVDFPDIDGDGIS